jgi:hypothetical protein
MHAFKGFLILILINELKIKYEIQKIISYSLYLSIKKKKFVGLILKYRPCLFLCFKNIFENIFF